MRQRYLVIACGLAFACLCGVLAAGEGKPRPLTSGERDAVKKAFSRLASGDDAAVERATTALVEIGPKVAALLDEEVRERRKRLYPFLYALCKVRKHWGLASSTEREEGTGKPPAPAKYLMEKMEAAKKLFADGRYVEAEALAAALLVVEPAVEFRREALRLIRRTKERLMQKNTLQLTLELDKTVFEVGETVEFRIRIANLSGNTVELAAPSGSRASFGRLRRLLEAYHVSGDYRKEFVPLQVDLTEDVTLPPGKAWVKRMLIPTKHLDAGAPVFRRYSIEGSIRPGSLLVGGRNEGRTLYFKPVFFDLVPKGYMHLASKPLAALKEALRDATPPHLPGGKDDYRLRIFLAAFLLDEQLHDEAAELLITSLGKVAGDATRVVMVALRRSTGADVPFDPAQWELWYLKKHGRKPGK